MHPGHLTLRIDSRFEHVVLVGLSLRAICAAVPFDEGDVNAVELCVVEAVNNAIEHAYAAEAGHAVEIEVVLDGQALAIDVRDRGRSMDWEAAWDRINAYAFDELAEGGRGLFIIRSLMDGLTYRSADGWNALHMVKRLPSGDDAATHASRG
jgi:serine/threonine-protein kinase RsbW